MINPLPIAAVMLVMVAAPSLAQSCPDVRTATDRHQAALLLANCLGDPNPKVRDSAVTRPQLDRLLAAIATQIAPRDPAVAYWAGEPDRLARAVIFIAQRKLHSDDEWKAWFATVMDPKPLASWDVAFGSEIGLRKRHNIRAFLLALFATSSSSEDAGIRQLLNLGRESLKSVP